MRSRPTALVLLLAPVALSALGARRLWDFAPYSHVRRAPAEKGAPPSGQPLKVEPAVLAQALGSVRYVAGKEEQPLFVPPEVQVLAKVLSEALAVAEPGEDLEVLSNWKRDTGLLNGSLGVTARVFVQDGKLNLIVQDARLDFMYLVNYEARMPEFKYGTRAKASAVVLKAEGAQSLRADWLVLTLAGSIPAAKPVPVPAAVPAPPPPPPRAASVEERLKDLKRFREQDLITEDEYARQKAELLKEFSARER